jgi:hypothetical protein
MISNKFPGNFRPIHEIIQEKIGKFPKIWKFPYKMGNLLSKLLVLVFVWNPLEPREGGGPEIGSEPLTRPPFHQQTLTLSKSTC